MNVNETIFKNATASTLIQISDKYKGCTYELQSEKKNGKLMHSNDKNGAEYPFCRTRF